MIMVKSKNNIVYTGTIEELKGLYIDGKMDTDKLLNWLSTSDSLEYDDDVKKTILKRIRKRKIDKLIE